MSSLKGNRDPRQSFMVGEGFVLYNDAIDQVIEQLGDTPLPTSEAYKTLIENEDVEREAKQYNCLRSSIGLYAVNKLLARQAHVEETSEMSRMRHFSLSDNEKEQVYRYTYYDGLDELDFAWIFSSALASATMHSFVEADVIQKTEAERIHLPEWADIISSDWFRSLTHTLALTGFGAYGGMERFGDHIKYHRRGAFEDQLNDRAVKKFKLPKQEVAVLTVEACEEGFHGAKAVVTPAFQSMLIGMLRFSSKDGLPGSYYDFGGSIGCPVARHSTVLPADYKSSMPRALRLQAIGHLSIAQTPDVNGNFLATQSCSAIDRNLMFIADQMRRFHLRNEGLFTRHEQYGS